MARKEKQYLFVDSTGWFNDISTGTNPEEALLALLVDVFYYETPILGQLFSKDGTEQIGFVFNQFVIRVYEVKPWRKRIR